MNECDNCNDNGYCIYTGGEKPCKTTGSKFMSKRLIANREILTEISKNVEKFPDWRFHQILQNMLVVKREAGECDYNIPDQFFEESEDTLRRIK